MLEACWSFGGIIGQSGSSWSRLGTQWRQSPAIQGRLEPSWWPPWALRGRPSAASGQTPAKNAPEMPTALKKPIVVQLIWLMAQWGIPTASSLWSVLEPSWVRGRSWGHRWAFLGLSGSKAELIPLRCCSNWGLSGRPREDPWPLGAVMERSRGVVELA
eukprot:4281184-Pyramimonas_sp.AAC.1